MAYRLAYCEDDSEVGHMFAGKIITAFEKRGCTVSVNYFSNPLDLEDSILSGGEYDALFLDVDMPQLNGISLSARLQKLGLANTVVFLSNREDMVYRSLQVRPVRFVRKSHFASEIGECVTALMKEIESYRAESVLFASGKESYRLCIRDIRYLEIVNQTLTVFTAQGSIELKYRMNDAETLLAPHGFIRIHKSYLVNYRCIFSILKDSVTLTDGQCLPLSRHRFQTVTAALLEWTRRELQKGEIKKC